jgi:hypothetical protein
MNVLFYGNSEVHGSPSNDWFWQNQVVQEPCISGVLYFWVWLVLPGKKTFTESPGVA